MSHFNLPTWFRVTSILTPWLLLIVFLSASVFAPQLMGTWLNKDSVDGGGLIEHLTVLVLIPGIIAGFYAFAVYRKELSPWWIAYWLFLWSLACVYFAGEEMSWGQWFFGWETPENFSEINDQNETNLHNISSWFDQKPRNLVELFIFLTGFIFPLIQLVLRKQWFTDRSRWFWVLPVNSLLSAGMFYTLVRFAGWIDDNSQTNPFGSSELRELCVALFLSLFLISYLARLRQKSTS